eukprot:375502_1
MPRRQSSGKGKNRQKHKHNKSEKKNNNYSSQRIEKEVKEIKIMIAQNDYELAMNRINIIEKNLSKNNKNLPLILNSLKCLILSYDGNENDDNNKNSLYLKINNLLSNNKYKWD